MEVVVGKRLAEMQLETKSAPEIKTIADVAGLVATQTAEFKSFTERMEKRIEDEKKEREDLEARMNRGGLAPNAGTKGDHAAERRALSIFVRSGDEAELKAMSVSSDPDGGYTVLPVMSADLTKRLFDTSPMRRLSRVETITSGDSFEEIDDRDEAGATWVGERASRPETDTPKIGKWRIPVHEIYSLQPVTQRLLDDSNRDIGAWVEDKIGDKFQRAEGVAYVTGDAIQKPRGFLNYPTSGDGDFARERGTIQHVKTGNAGDFPATNPADKLKELMWALRAPYRAGAVWQMNSNTASRIDKFKNTTGDYIWRDGMTAGAPPSLLGYPVEMNEDMPDIGADACAIAFGNMKLAYCIVEKAGIKFLRDPYTNKPNVLFYAYRRVGGGLTNDDALKLLKFSA